MNIKAKFYNLLRIMVAKYDNKYDPDKDKLFMCNSFNTRNRYKRKEYQIPEDQPQCPIYKDNRCCGGCKLARTCDHCVDCNCFGFTHCILGGKEIEMTHKASHFYGKSRLKEDGKFDWDYYWKQRDKKKKGR